MDSEEELLGIVQEARRNAGYQVTNRVTLHWRVRGSPEPTETIRAHEGELASEVLATSVVEGPPASTDGFFEVHDEEMGLHIWLRVAD